MRVLGHLRPASLALVTAAVVGCGGCSNPKAAPDIPPGGPASPAAAPDPHTPGAMGRGQDFPTEAILPPAAKQARSKALKDLLGASATKLGKQNPGELSDDGPEPELEKQAGSLDALPGSSGLGADPKQDARRNGNALGLFVPIEDPEDGTEPLLHFHEALRALKSGQDEDGKVRILAYGGSHTDADIYTQYMRTYLQTRFGNGGHGFIQLARPWRWYRHVDMGVESSRRWLTEHYQRGTARKDGYYGLMGASMSTSRKGEWTRVYHKNDTVGSIYDLSFLAQPDGGSFILKVDGKRRTVVSTKAEDYGPGYERLELPEGDHEIEIRVKGDGEVRLFGMTVERGQPGVVVDTLGIGGTRAANQLGWDLEVWGDNVRRREPDLYLLFFGTNEATDEEQPISMYEADLRSVLERLAQVAPQASCLLMGPGDFPYQTEYGWAPRPRVRQIVEVQRQVASDMGCGFWDTVAFMGGEGSMHTWVTAEPQMAKSDHIHFTRRGYVRIGMGVVDAMMLDFDAAGL